MSADEIAAMNRKRGVTEFPTGAGGPSGEFGAPLGRAPTSAPRAGPPSLTGAQQTVIDNRERIARRSRAVARNPITRSTSGATSGNALLGATFGASAAKTLLGA